jgi:hypothetical protein
MEDHDQRFKILLQEFILEFMWLFFPEWAAKLDFTKIEWLGQELQLNPPQGEKVEADLVAKIAALEAIPPLRHGESDSYIAIIHIEVESPDRVKSFRHRMFDFYWSLRRKYNIPVLPITLFLRVGLDGIGWDTYEEVLWGKKLVSFDYTYVGLPALPGEKYLQGENILGVALAALMKLPPERRAELKTEAMKRFDSAPVNEAKRYLLAECLEAYFPLNTEEQADYDRLLESDKNREVKAMSNIWIERGRQEGRQEERREILIDLLRSRFGPLNEATILQIAELPTERMKELVRACAAAHSLEELGLPK